LHCNFALPSSYSQSFTSAQPARDRLRRSRASGFRAGLSSPPLDLAVHLAKMQVAAQVHSRGPVVRVDVGVVGVVYIFVRWTWILSANECMSTQV
jgi:hypothetical protein